MFGKKLMMDIVDRSSETQADRRGFLRGAGVAGLGVLGATAGGAALAAPAFANGDSSSSSGDAISDGAILNFALNLEYLEAQFYTIAVYGGGLPGSILTGTGKQGGVTGGHAVPFKDKKVKAYATEIAGDERLHVEFLRGALGGAAVSQPAINFTDAFTAAATAAGLIKAGQSFDPFANDQSFLLGAYLFEDVGVSAYKGGAPLISNKTYLEAAAGILAIEAYHAGLIRTKLYEMGAGAATNAISAARNALDMNDIDAGVLGANGKVNITLADGRTAIAPSRTSPQVHNIVYLNPAKGVTSGGFFPNGTNNPDPRLTTT